jgi:hypothetical protein
MLLWVRANIFKSGMLILSRRRSIAINGLIRSLSRLTALPRAGFDPHIMEERFRPT